MSQQEITATVAELQELRRKQEELEAEIASMQDRIKAHMAASGVDSLTAGAFKVTWKSVSSARLDANMKKLLDTLNDLRGIRWKILSQAQGLDRDLTVVAEMITAVIISLHENYGQTWLEFDAEGKRAREGSMHFPMVLLESRQFEIEPKPVT